MNDDRTLADLIGKDIDALSLEELREYIGVTQSLCRVVRAIPGQSRRAGSVDVESKLVELYRSKAKSAAGKLGLPAGVFERYGHGGMRAFVPYCFLDFPLAVFERPSQATSAQMELQLPSGETFKREVYTIRHNRKLALTGRQENILFTLLNDEFLQLTQGAGGASVIVGSVERLRELTGGQVRLGALLDDLRAIGEMRVSIRDMTKPKDGAPYAIRGSLFTLDITPEPGAWRAVEAAPSGKHPFLMVVNDMLAFQWLRGMYQRIDLGKFWSIPKPRDRHVYSYLVRNRASVPVFVSTFCEANGFSYVGTKQNKFKTRNAIRRSLDAVSTLTGEFMHFAGAGDWFIDRGKIGWCAESIAMPGKPGVRRIAGFAASIPADILRKYYRKATSKNMTASEVRRLVRQVGFKLKAEYKNGGIPAYDAEVARYRAEVKDW